MVWALLVGFLTLRKQTKAVSFQFDRLVRPHVPTLYSLAYKLTGSRFDAEDIVQDTLIKLYPKTVEMAAVEQLRPWLSRVIYNQFVDHVRRQQRSPLDDKNRQAGREEDALEKQVSGNSGPEESAQQSRQLRKVEKELELLSHNNRALVVMHIMEGFTLQELSELFDVPLGTLKSRLHRVKAELKEKLSVEPFPDVQRVMSKGQLS